MLTFLRDLRPEGRTRVRNDDEPLQPGEWRDIDAPGGNIRDAIIPLPYKEPSATLGQLLGALVDGGSDLFPLRPTDRGWQQCCSGGHHGGSFGAWHEGDVGYTQAAALCTEDRVSYSG